MEPEKQMESEATESIETEEIGLPPEGERGQVGGRLKACNIFSEEDILFLNKFLRLKGYKSIADLSRQAQVPAIGLRDWLKTGDDLVFCEADRWKLLHYVGYDRNLCGFSKDRVHYIYCERNFFGTPQDSVEKILDEVLLTTAEKSGEVFEVAELLTGRPGKLFKQVRYYALKSSKSGQRVLLAVRAPKTSAAMYRTNHKSYVGVSGMRKVSVRDMADDVEKEQLLISEFDSIFSGDGKRKTFKDVEDYCRAIGMSANQLMDMLRNDVQEKWHNQKMVTGEQEAAKEEFVDIAYVEGGAVQGQVRAQRSSRGKGRRIKSQPASN